MIDLQELRDAVTKAFPADQLAPPRDASWQLAAEMGWLAIELAEERGGLELGRTAAAAVHFELGRMLSAIPLGSVLAALQAIAASNVLADRQGWIDRIVGGEYIAVGMLPGTVKMSDDGFLSGTVPGVFDADMATHVLVSSVGRIDLVPLDRGELSVVQRELWDNTRSLFDIRLERYAPAPERMIASGDDAAALDDLISSSGQLAIAADSLGGAQAIFAMTVDYLKTRRQFGRPLALFQSLKHRVADLKVRLEAAEALFWARTGDGSDLPALGALKAHCNTVFRDVVEEAIQLHGGIGLTQEYPCHLFFKRAMLNCQLCGNSDHWEAQEGRRLLAAV